MAGCPGSFQHFTLSSGYPCAFPVVTREHPVHIPICNLGLQLLGLHMQPPTPRLISKTCPGLSYLETSFTATCVSGKMFRSHGVAGQSSIRKLLASQALVMKWDSSIYRPTSFYRACFIALQQILRFLQVWQLCLQQVHQRHFSNRICSLHVSVSHFGSSRHISNFFIIIIFVMVICDHWSLMLLLQKDYNSLKAQMVVNIF